MALAKRVVLFLLVNALVVITISVITSVFGLNSYLHSYGLNQGQLAVFCAVWGMGGAFISLLLSRVMAKWTMSLQLIDPNTPDPGLRELYSIVSELSRKVGLPNVPEVAIYDSPELNAFATGPSKSQSLVAVSSGLLQRMNRDEIEGVLGHEISHIANGDMVTMTLLQGVVNAFVMFFARIIAYAVTVGRQSDNQRGSVGLAYYAVQIILEIVLMLLGSLVVAWFSRWREYRADAGGAELSTTRNMVSALQALKAYSEERSAVPANLKTLMISGGQSPLMNLFASHPPLDDRIAKLTAEGL